MLSSYTVLEILLAVAIAAIVGNELFGVLKARRDGLSQNVSRVLTHSAMLALIVVYGFLALSYLPLETSNEQITTFGTPTFNGTLLITGLMLCLLATWESFSMVRARRLKLTTNLSRLVSRAAVVLLILVMMGLSVRKWDHYLLRLEATYAQDIPDLTPAN